MRLKRRGLLGAMAAGGLAGAGAGAVSGAGTTLATAGGVSTSVRWEAAYERSDSWTFEAATATEDGGAVVCGWESRTEPYTGDAVVAKIDADGAIEWETTVSGNADTYALWDVTTTDDGYAAIGGLDVQDRDQIREYRGFASGQLVVTFDEDGTEDWRQVLDSDQWLHSVASKPGRVIVGRENELIQFRGQYDRDRTQPIEVSPGDDNDAAVAQPVSIYRHDDRLYVACTRIESFVDDDGRRHVTRREPLVLESTVDPLNVLEEYRFEFDRYHWASDLAVTDEGIYLAGVQSASQDFIRQPDLEGWLLKVDHDGNREWYESVAADDGLQFTSITVQEDWEALLATGQTLAGGRVYAIDPATGDAEPVYEPGEDGLLAEVTVLENRTALATGAEAGSNDNPFAASLALAPPEDDVSIEASPASPEPGEPVELEAAVEGDWDVASVEWGGAVDGEGRTAEATFDDAGARTVEVTVTNDIGGSVTVDRTLQVESSGDDEVDEGDDGTPGFGVGVALAGLAGGAGALYGRTKLGRDES